MTLGGRVEVTEDTFAEVELRSEPDLNFDLHSPVVRLGRSGEGCRRYLHHRYRMPNAATIATAILKRCITFIRRRQCWPKRYPMPAMNVTHAAAPRKLNSAKTCQRMRRTPASGPAKTRIPKMKRAKK